MLKLVIVSLMIICFGLCWLLLIGFVLIGFVGVVGVWMCLGGVVIDFFLGEVLVGGLGLWV